LLAPRSGFWFRRKTEILSVEPKYLDPVLQRLVVENLVLVKEVRQDDEGRIAIALEIPDALTPTRPCQGGSRASA
jgi:hypothetical protein